MGIKTNGLIVHFSKIILLMGIKVRSHGQFLSSISHQTLLMLLFHIQIQQYTHQTAFLYVLHPLNVFDDFQIRAWNK